MPHEPNELLRKSLHIAFGLFAVTLRWLPWWLAAGVAAAGGLIVEVTENDILGGGGNPMAQAVKVADKVLALNWATELKPHHVEEALDAVEASVSLNQTIGDGDGELGDLFADRTVDDPIDAADLSFEQQRVREALADLPERERMVLELRFGFVESGDGASLEQIGKKLGLTRERIRQLESSALVRLEERLRVEALPSGESLAARA